MGYIGALSLNGGEMQGVFNMVALDLLMKNMV